MPTFENVKALITLDFEVFCGSCGCGLCNDSGTQQIISKHTAQVTVNACQNCIEEAREEIRLDLEDQIQGLQDRLTLLGE